MGNNNYCALSKTHLDWEIKFPANGRYISQCTCLIPIMLIQPEEMHPWKTRDPQKLNIMGNLEGSFPLEVGELIPFKFLKINMHPGQKS